MMELPKFSRCLGVFFLAATVLAGCGNSISQPVSHRRMARDPILILRRCERHRREPPPGSAPEE